MTAAAIHPGPAVLGRGVVVLPGGAVPQPWVDAPRVRVDAAVLRDPAATVADLHQLWLTRRPVVIELAVPNEELREPERTDEPVHRLRSDFDFGRERLFFLVWANTYDARQGPPVWWWGRKAERLGAGPDARADIVLPDGRPAWCDGGPHQVLALDTAIVHRESIELGRLTTVGRADLADTELTDDQREAVLHEVGAARIVAPAGSGKTRVLAARLRHLVEDRHVEPELVTAVAYNNRAAAELSARLPGDLGVEVRTIHALGFSILRDAARAAGRRAPEVVEERAVRQRLEPLVPVRPRVNTDVLAPYIEAMGRIRLGLVDPSTVEAERDDVPDLAAVYAAYRERLLADGAVDFDELVHGAIELLVRDPAVRSRAQSRRRHLLVDEFQDLTPAYLLLLRLLAAPAYQVFGVGDEDQTIYGYAGASPEHLVRYDHWFPGAAGHALVTNFRCPPSVVVAAANLLSHNRRRVPKEIRAGRSEGAEMVRERCRSAEVGPVAVAAVRRHLAGGADPTSIAVLSRVSSALMPIQVLLTQEGVPCEHPVGIQVLRRTGLRAALAYVRLAIGGEQMARADLDEVLNRPSRRLSRRVRELLARRRSWTTDQLREVAPARLPEKEAERLVELCADLDDLARRGPGTDTEELLRFVRDGIGLGRAVDTLDRSRGDDGGHGDDLAALLAVAALHPEPGGFEEWLRSVLDAPGADGVRLSTVHRVKGMEWDHVVVAPADASLMPHRLADDIEEERRILHVAITRARTSLTIVASDEAPSPFLPQLDEPAPADAPAPVEVPRHPAATEDDGPSLEATVGTEVVLVGGFRGLVREVGPDGVVVALEGGGLTRVPLGDRVAVDGRTVRLVGGGPDDAVVEAIKTWRRERARRDGVPAYVVLADAHVDDIALRRPTTLEELADCHGIGPSRLERYGDDLLALLEEV